MDDVTINYLLKRCEKLSNFHGVFGKDAIKISRFTPYHAHSFSMRMIFIIFNRGTHWVAVYIDEDNALNFYDSFSEKLKMKGLKDFIKPFNLNYNKIQIQSDESAACGQHCIFFLIHRSRDMSITSIINKYFNKNWKLQNDLYVYYYVKRRYGL